MKNLITILLLFILAVSAHGQSIGFNFGQLHHHAQLEWRNNGYVPQAWVDSVKAVTPKEWQSFGRKSGTMSNYWNTQANGYNHLAHDLQISRQANTQQPNQSYIYPFIQFYKQWGFDSIIYTLSTHNAYLNKQHDLMIADLKYVLSQGVNITHICLDNEMWMDARLVGLDGGSPTLADKVRLLNINGFQALFTPNARVEAPTRATINAFLDYLEMVSAEVRKMVPNVTILQTVDNTTHMRGRLVLEEVAKRKYYDGITPHIYIKAANKSQLELQLSQRLNQYRQFDRIYITEFNYSFGNDCDGGNPPQYVKSKAFIHDGVNFLIKQPNVRAVMVHTLWHGSQDCNGYLRVW